MSRFRTTGTIIRYSLDIMGQHPRLLAFPLVSLVAFALIFVFALAPLLFGVSVAQMWHALTQDEARDAIFTSMRSLDDSTAGSRPQMASAGYLAYSLCITFCMTFINMAFYSQIIEAMSGGKVSVAGGFAQATSRLAAIAVWSMLSGVISFLLGAAQENSAVLGAVAFLAGIAWSAVSLFVIPIMINEPRRRGPFEYLKISIALVKRVWAEGLIGIAGMALVFLALMIGMTVLNFALMSAGGKPGVSLITFVSMASLGIFALLYLAYQVFECGLYVYATQGVPPGTFDPDTFERAWSVKDPQHSTLGDTEAGIVRRARWSKRWLILPAAVFCIPVLWFILSPSSSQPLPPLPPEEVPTIGRVSINLADLNYKLNLEHLQAAGLFPDKTCAKCDFSAAGTWVRIGSKIDSGLRVGAARQRDHVYIFFKGTDTAAGQKLLDHTIEALREQFPGHEDAIAPVDEIAYVPRTTVARWDAIPGAASYTVEIDCFHCCGEGKWCTEVGSKWKIVPDLAATAYTFDWVGAQPGRWRVWSIDANGKRGPKSGWTDFDYSM